MAAGRKRIQHDEAIAKQVQAMSQCGVSQQDIACAVGLAKNTLVRLYRPELERGMALAHAAVGKKFFDRCMAGDTACLIFYLKAQMGWSEKPRKKEAEANAPLPLYTLPPKGQADA